MGETVTSPYRFNVQNLSIGLHDFYGKIYSGSDYGITNIIRVQVGTQIPYNHNINNVPGIIETGLYDDYEGGLGQNITYFDNSPFNQGTYRTDQYVDVEYFVDIEGPTLGWIEAGEWVEYSIAVEEPGYYDLEYRYASDIPGGGGPFYFMINGIEVSNHFSAGYTGDWYNWQSGFGSDIVLNAGEHILRMVFIDGGFNLGRMTFSFNRNLDYSPPVANAGGDLLVILLSLIHI